MEYDDDSPAMRLYRRGLFSETIGPEREWAPADRSAFQRRHDTFWGIVSLIITTTPGDYENLPDWMTEEGSIQLEANN